MPDKNYNLKNLAYIEREIKRKSKPSPIYRWQRNKKPLVKKVEEVKATKKCVICGMIKKTNHGTKCQKCASRENGFGKYCGSKLT